MKVITVTLNPCIDKTLILESFEVGVTNRAVYSRSDVGGKGINVSKMLNSFGIDSVATGIFAGNTGMYIDEYLNTSGISAEFAYGEGETRTNLKIIDDSAKITTEVNEPGYPAGTAYDEFRSILLKLLPTCDILVLSGSAPSDIGDSVYMELISLAKEMGIRVILDADGEKLRKGVLAKPYAIKPNKAEFEALTGQKFGSVEEIVKAAREINESGIDLVIVSLGEDGAIFVRDSLVLKSTPFPIDVKSPAAAGDSMVGALIYALNEELTLTETAKVMTAAGTITAAKDGTQLATFGEISANFERVKIDIIDEI